MKARSELHCTQEQRAFPAAAQLAQTIPQDSFHSHIDAVLKRRIGQLVAIGQLIPPILRMTLAQGTRCRKGIGKQEIAAQAEEKR